MAAQSIANAADAATSGWKLMMVHTLTGPVPFGSAAVAGLVLLSARAIIRGTPPLRLLTVAGFLEFERNGANLLASPAEADEAGIVCNSALPHLPGRR